MEIKAELKARMRRGREGKAPPAAERQFEMHKTRTYKTRGNPATRRGETNPPITNELTLVTARGPQFPIKQNKNEIKIKIKQKENE